MLQSSWMYITIVPVLASLLPHIPDRVTLLYPSIIALTQWRCVLQGIPNHANTWQPPARLLAGINRSRPHGVTKRSYLCCGARPQKLSNSLFGSTLCPLCVHFVSTLVRLWFDFGSTLSTLVFFDFVTKSNQSTLCPPCFHFGSTLVLLWFDFVDFGYFCLVFTVKVHSSTLVRLWFDFVYFGSTLSTL